MLQKDRKEIGINKKEPGLFPGSLFRQPCGSAVMA
ncbi:hypothetical protein SAMN06298210_11328 [Prevotellaceae bacterium KH2P17]|nr:hypothetical protein SAMN06298210_11328 [Prevotellaceae bacterium KH2P17]